MASKSKALMLDGSTLEGGGQILRNAISFSALLSKPISIHNIRKGRDSPGLKNQHRTGIQLAAEIAGHAQVTGTFNGSNEVHFTPGTIHIPGQYEADSKTAGSVTLLLQVALPLLLFADPGTPPSTLVLRGGTNAIQAPQVDYSQHVLIPFLQKHLGIGRIDLDLRKRGYYPKGGGEVHVTVHPLAETIPTPDAPSPPLKGIKLLERGEVMAVHGIAHFAGLPVSIGKGMADGARRKLQDYFTSAGVENTSISIEMSRERNDNSSGAGSGIVLWAELDGGGILGGSSVGRKGLDPMDVGENAATELIKALEAGGCVDEWLQDQIIIFMALAAGKSEVDCGKRGLTLHAETAIWVAEQLTNAKFSVSQDFSGHSIIACDGIGYTARYLSRGSSSEESETADDINTTITCEQSTIGY